MRPVLCAAMTLLALIAAMPAWSAPKADVLAKRLSAHAPSCGRFEQSRWLADLDTRLDSRGTFRRQADGLIWQTLSPIEDRLRLSDDNDALPPGLRLMLPVLTGLLSGDWQALEPHFKVELDGVLEDWQAELVPIDAAVGERLAHLTVSGGERVERVELAFASGDRLTLTLTATPCRSLDDGDSAS